MWKNRSLVRESEEQGWRVLIEEGWEFESGDEIAGPFLLISPAFPRKSIHMASVVNPMRHPVRWKD
jgi:hypothetical protein